MTDEMVFINLLRAWLGLGPIPGTDAETSGKRAKRSS